MKTLKTLLIVTHVDFWRNGAGHRTRLSSLVNYLKDQLTITVVYAGIFFEKDATIISKEYTGISVIALEPNRTATFKEHGELFRSFIDNTSFDAVMIEYIEMAFVLPMLNENCVTILDTHDLVGDRIRSFRENGIYYSGVMMSDEEELEIFNCFDKVLLIQQHDYKKIAAQMGSDRVLLVPHAATLRKKSINKHVKNIGFVASEYQPNVEAIRWFIEEVWSKNNYEDITLNIYGNVCRYLKTIEGVSCHGFVKDLDVVYNTCDIMINPVKAGAGLKIKNMEALACGLPLITTTHAATGLVNSECNCFLVADSAAEFASALNKLISNESLREELGANAFEFINENFSPAKCYGGLLNYIQQYQLTE